MQEYPMRERIYLPVVRFGVPAPMFTGVSALALSVAFFNFIRIGRRPLWLQHTLRALLVSSRERAALPVDDLNEAWLEDADGAGQGVTRQGERKAKRANPFRFEHL